MLRFVRLVCVVFAILIATAADASAHPLGNFTVNRFSGIEVSPRAVRVRYALDIAEVPTFQEFATIDSDRNNVASPSELSAYAQKKAAFVIDGVRIAIDGVTTARPALGDAAAALNKGQGGLQVLRLDITFWVPLPRTTATIAYRDYNLATLPGWREVVATGVDGEAVIDGDVPLQSVSNGLRAYPARLLTHPPSVTSARIRVAPGAQVTPSPSPTDARTVVTTRLYGKEFASLIERDLTLPSIVVAIMLALGFGALHAIAPGHGKTVMAGYLLGTGGRIRHAVGLGVAVSLMHTASVIALSLLTLWLTNVFAPATVFPWLALASGLIIAGLGAGLFVVRWRARTHARAPHEHEHLPPTASPFSRKGLAAIAISGGLLPSPTAVVVLLGAVALHRVAFGVVLVTAFSVGLAAALAAAGILVLRARSLAESRWGIGPASILPSLSSAALFAVGVFLTVRAAMAL